MDAPRIQYAKTSDRVNIAYYAIGDGPAIVYMAPIPFRHIQRQWDIWPQDRLMADLGAKQGRRLVQFDPRGMGSSSRVETFNLDGFVTDLETVVDSLHLQTFDLVAITYSTPIAVAYAARHPERLSHLVLLGPFADGSVALDTPVGNALRALRGQDWEIYTRSAMQIILGWENSELAQQMSVIMREAIRSQDLLPITAAIEAFDVSDLLQHVRVPTLVVPVSASRLIPVEQSRAVAAAIPGAQTATPPPGQDLLVVGQYLGLLGDVGVASVEPRATATAVILFADIVNSTPLTEMLGDAVFRAKARDLDSALRKHVTEHHGTCIDAKTLGDGVLATFGSAKQAIEAALACGRAGDEMGLPLHLGLHAGDVIREDNNVFGGAVNIAARISGLSAPGEVLVSGTVRDLARTSSGVSFEDRGERELKGVGEAVRVFRVVQGEGD